VVYDLHRREYAAWGGENEPGVWDFRNRRRGCDGEVMNVRGKVFAIVMVMMTLPLGAAERISMKVSPAVAFAPANLVVRAVVEADARNRAIEIVAESADFYRSSEVELEGDKAPRTNQFEFRSLPPGVYEVRASLIGDDGQQRGVVRQQVNVIAVGSGDHD
jgi:hypothetical protein